MTETTRHPATTQLLRWFEFDHLRPGLREISEAFHDLAHNLADDPLIEQGPELTTALRKLLEAKDCAVRAAIAAADQRR
jgi:hypothetical protein